MKTTVYRACKAWIKMFAGDEIDRRFVLLKLRKSNKLTYCKYSVGLCKESKCNKEYIDISHILKEFGEEGKRRYVFYLMKVN